MTWDWDFVLMQACTMIYVQEVHELLYSPDKNEAYTLHQEP